MNFTATYINRWFRQQWNVISLKFDPYIMIKYTEFHQNLEGVSREAATDRASVALTWFWSYSDWNEVHVHKAQGVGVYVVDLFCASPTCG